VVVLQDLGFRVCKSKIVRERVLQQHKFFLIPHTY
jgi:hypothetical protein